ncbi:hypothetical protein [Microbulbifer litoralis]|uniref:hypothetical protein n=1 Tax=Microbulbifer litoralis TaxID=2933965 RepID=UPI00202899DF|nr:hypothetical protein [Microbulbifer sp. GX H0434]
MIDSNTHNSDKKNGFSVAPLILLAGLAASCGGGGGSAAEPTPQPNPAPQPDPDPEPTQEMTGSFIGARVEGLRYTTPTTTGLTNADSEFVYLVGETVSFSIGGIALGSADGATKISPFDLFDMQAPETEMELRAEFENFDDITNFDRVANIVMLLATLDRDGDPRNGINLTGWDETLSDAHLDFAAPLFYFREASGPGTLSALANRYQFNYHPRSFQMVHIALPLANLYRELKITVPVQARTERRKDHGNDGSYDTWMQTDFDDYGRRIKMQRGDYEDGAIDEERNWQYDERHYVISSDKTEYESDGSVEETLTSSYKYDEQDNRIQILRTSTNGILESEYTVTREYDDVGNPLAEEEVGEGIANYWTKRTYSYNDLGQIESREYVSDHNADGKLDYADSRNYSRDETGNLLSEAYKRHSDGNTDSTPDLLERNVYTLNAVGQRVERERERYADGVLESTRQDRYTRNDSGLLVEAEYSNDSDADGIPDLIEKVEIEYDDKGHRLTEKQMADEDVDGNYDYFATESNTYNDRNLLTETRKELDRNTDSIPDEIEVTIYEYQEERLTSVTEKEDINADGDFDSAESVEYSYNSRGNQSSRLKKKDDDGDGQYEEQDLEEYSYTTLQSGGVYYLVYLYTN